MENIDIFTLEGTEIYSFCSEELPKKDINTFIIDCPTCCLSNEKLTNDTYMEAIELVAPSNGYFLIGFLKDKYDIYKIVESIYNLDISKIQSINKDNFIFKGVVLLYEGRPFSYLSCASAIRFSFFAISLAASSISALPLASSFSASEICFSASDILSIASL